MTLLVKLVRTVPSPTFIEIKSKMVANYYYL